MAEAQCGFAANDGVGFGRNLGRGRFSGADGPDGFIGNQNFLELVFGQAADPAYELVNEHCFSGTAFAFFQLFAHADNRGEAVIEGGHGLAEDVFFGFAESTDGVRSGRRSRACSP